MTHGIGVYKDIADGIESYMSENGFDKVEEMVGLAHEIKGDGLSCKGMTR